MPGYGYMADELYFLSCVDHLAWGYVDHPPFSIVLLGIVRWAVGDSELVLRLVAGLLGGAVVLGSGALARELGGGRRAQVLTGLALLASPGVQAVGSYYSMNVIESVLWLGVALAVARLVHNDGRYGWVPVGLLLGAGILNKLSTVWLGVGLGLGLLFTPQRSWLATRGPWLAAAIAAAIGAPHLAWQLASDWPILGFIEGYGREVAATGATPTRPLDFVVTQILVMNPIAFPVWVIGLLAYFLDARLRRFRLLGWMWVGVAGILLVSGRAQAYYLLPAFPPLIAAGGVILERYVVNRQRIFGAATTILALAGVLVLPIAMPLLSPDVFESLQEAVGIPDSDGQLPEHFGWRVGWPEIVEAVALVRKERPADVRILTTDFPTAAALDQLGRNVGLPKPMGTHNSWWSWGPTGPPGASVIIVTSTGHRVLADFAHVEPIAEIDCPHCVNWVRRQRIFLARDPRAPISELWPTWQDFR